jgi:hypothetical protein
MALLWYNKLVVVLIILIEKTSHLMLLYHAKQPVVNGEQSSQPTTTYNQRDQLATVLQRGSVVIPRRLPINPTIINVLARLGSCPYFITGVIGTGCGQIGIPNGFSQEQI